MMLKYRFATTTAVATLALAGFAAVAPLPMVASAQAQDASVAARIDRIERELRAVQRRVFPGGAGTFQPEVQPATPTAPGAQASSTPIADLNARVDALEAQLARITEQAEQTSFRQRELEASITRLRTDMAARLDRLEAAAASAQNPSAEADPAPAAALPPRAPTPAPTPTPAPRPTVPAPTPAPRPTPAPTPAPRPTPAPAARPPVAATPSPTPPAAGTAAERRARVAALEQPATGNAAEDAYLFGYRLWNAGLYPEAQVQLKKVVDTYPTHRRASYAGNLLGRAYLDNGQPSLAVGAFYDNYRTRPRGERAPDSVYYMGMALIRLDRRTDACRTFDEFDRVYGPTASDALKAQVVAARGQARC